MKDNPHYAPANLLDMLQLLLGVNTDRQLADRFGVLSPQICKIRHRNGKVSSALLISMHEETDLSITVLRGLMGDYRESTAESAKHPAEPPPNCLHQLHHAGMVSAFARASIAARMLQPQQRA